VLQLRHPWSDGTTHLLFDPLELLERLAVLTLRQAQGHPEQRRGMIPRPRINLILYHGILPFDFAQGTPSAVEGWGHVRRGPSTLLRTIPSHVEGWRSLVVGVGNTADRLHLPTEIPPRLRLSSNLSSDKLGRGLATARLSPARDGGAASGAGTAPRRRSGRPEPSRRAPLIETGLLNQPTDTAVLDSYA